MQQMEKDVEELKDLRKLKAEASRRSDQLRQKKDDATARCDGIKEQAKSMRAKYEDAKAKLAADATAVQIEELEGRVKHQESTVYALSDYIETKGAESHF